VRSLLATTGVSCEFRRLDLGDYLVDGRLLVERKSLPDLLASIEDGRLFRQAARLATCGTRAALLLEGSSADLVGRKMHREAIQGALITVSIVWGLPVLRALDGAESSRLMLCAADQLQRHVQGMAHRPGSRLTGKRRLQSHILQGLPGVGRRLAERLIERFGNVKAVVSAPEAELLEVQGLGKKKAERICWAVGENREPYRAFPPPQPTEAIQQFQVMQMDGMGLRLLLPYLPEGASMDDGSRKVIPDAYPEDRADAKSGTGA
jgi:DNA excision repair protein ERCC-4